MKTGRILIIALVVGWVIAMAVIGYKMVNKDQVTSSKKRANPVNFYCISKKVVTGVATFF